MALLNLPGVPDNLPFSIHVIGAILSFSLVYYIYTVITAEAPYKDFPLVSLPEEGLGPKASWIRQGRNLLIKGTETVNGPFQVMTGTGPKIMLPNRFAEELKNADNVSLLGAMSKDFFVEFPGFEAFKHGMSDEVFLPEVIRTKLTTSLGIVTRDLVEETTMALQEILGDNPEWQQMAMKDRIVDLIARMTARVFLGLPLCRNKRWLQIAKDYTIDAFISARLLRILPSFSRPFLHWILPHCIKLRRAFRDAENLIQPEIERRKDRARKALAAGQKPPKTADAIGWMYEVAKERAEEKNYTANQLMLTIGSVHTTAEGMAQAMLDLCAHPEFLQPLREEVIQVIGQEGWTKQALYKMRLMDSFLKESQRIHPPNALSMGRLILAPLKLSDGSVLPAGSRVSVITAFNDPSVYKNPSVFDPYRFLREREKGGQTNAWQHVSTSPAHLGFGYGPHACPGRFLASTEMKIAIAHLIMKYDWKLVEDGTPLTWEFEMATLANPKVKVLYRRRQEEIDLDKLPPAAA